MRQLSILILIITLAACGPVANTDKLQRQVDSLQQKLNGAYRPGLGEFMLGIQTHHSKLWFAGQAQNWKLADFEINEIREAVDDIRKYAADRPEVASLGMITSPVDSVGKAIDAQDTTMFRRSFVLFTNTCNDCHVATKHDFNVIRVPGSSIFANQDFAPKK